jgi:hypothetical protein
MDYNYIQETHLHSGMNVNLSIFLILQKILRFRS